MSEHRATLPAWHPLTYLKAVLGFLAPGVAFLAVPMALGHPPAEPDVWKAVAAMLTTGFAVYVAGNRDRGEAPADA